MSPNPRDEVELLPLLHAAMSQLDTRPDRAEGYIRQVIEMLRARATPPTPVSTTPAEMPLLDYACNKCGTQQHAGGMCANCGSYRLRRQTPASPFTVPELLLCPFCAEVPVADGNHWASVVHKATCWRTFIMESRVEHFHERAFAAWNTRFGRRLGATMIRDEVYHAALGELCDPDAGEVETNALALSIAEKVFDAIIERAQSAPTAEGEAEVPADNKWTLEDAQEVYKAFAGQCLGMNEARLTTALGVALACPLSTTTAPTPVADERLREIRDWADNYVGYRDPQLRQAFDHIDYLLTYLSQAEAERIKLVLELAKLRVKPIVDAEKKGEDYNDIMNLRFTSGK